MSFLVTQKTIITNLRYFQTACKKNQVMYNQGKEGEIRNGLPVEARLIDQVPSEGQNLYPGFLVRGKEGFQLMIDSDANYSSLTRRLGPNGGKLMRDYAQEFIEQEMTAQGGCLSEAIEQEDGGIILKVTMP